MPKSAHAFFQKILVIRNAVGCVLVASALALTFAFILQYGFDYHPCVLCLWQRVPYGAAFLFSAIALGWQPYGKKTQFLLGLCAFTFSIGAMLAIFHTGVEQHWWIGTSGCAVTPLHGASAEDMRTALLHTVVARCDEVTWTFLGLSMANWNVPLSLVLALFSGLAARRR